MKRLVVWVSIGLAVLSVSGCSEEPGDKALPGPASSVPGPAEQTPSSMPGQSELPHSGAPAVSDPLPESVLSGDPCEALTSQQVKVALGAEVSEGERRDLDEVGPGCGWSNPATFGGLQIGFHTVTRQGLSATYANAKPRSAIFRELGSIQGFPAVAYKDGEDDRICTVVVGLADEYSITSTIGLSVAKKTEGVDSCVPAEQVVELVVGNLKAKAGR